MTATTVPSTSTRHRVPATVLACSGLTKTYGGHTAVDNLDLEVGQGEIFGILGANGAGKTTSVECAQGLRRPDRGTIRVLGLDPIADQAKLRGRVGSQLQQANLPERLKVREAIRLFADDRTQAGRAMEEWELGPIASTPFGGLSGGQRQRLFLALALLNDPEIVFLDELTQGLDPSARSEVWELIEQVRDRGTTVVLVTHFMNEAEALCDRVAVMADGRLVDLDTPAGLINRHGGGVRMRFAIDPATAAKDGEWLGRVPGVRSVRHDRHEVEVTGIPSIIFRIGAELVARNAVPDDVRVSQPSLEEALLTILDRPTTPDAMTKGASR
ncbi:MAG: ABC transporter ATP-binding protein [Actinomycetota bacterium]